MSTSRLLKQHIRASSFPFGRLVMPVRKKRAFKVFAALICVSFALSALSQTNKDYLSGSSFECTQVSLDDIDESLLTKEERLALLDGALSDSIDNYTSCVAAVQKDMTGGGAGAGGGQGAGVDGQANAASSGAAASSQNQSTETTTQTQNSSSSSGAQIGSTTVPNTNSSTTPVSRQIIKPKDNASIICKLLYEEIQDAQGASREGLEKQYNDYQCGQ